MVRYSAAARKALAARDEAYAELEARHKKTTGDLGRATKTIAKKDETIAKKDETIKELRADKRQLRAECTAKDAEARKSERKAERDASTMARQKEEIAEWRRKYAAQARTLRQYVGPHIPASKTRQRRNEERRKEAEEGGGAKAGAKARAKPRRKPGGQPGRRATLRKFTPDRHTVIKKPDSCKKDCGGHIRVNGYRPKTMYERPPPPPAVAIASQCPVWECVGCGETGTATAGVAVPLETFEPEAGDAEPKRPLESGGGGEGDHGAAPAAEAPAAEAPAAEAPAADEVVEAIRSALGGGGIDVDAPANDIPRDPSEPFSIRMPQNGVFGVNSMASIIKNHLNRLTIRMNRKSEQDDGVEVSEGQVSNIVMRTGAALQPGLFALIALLAGARVIHADRTSYNMNGEAWGLWVFFDPLRKIAVYWLSPDGDNDVLARILGAWNGFIVCDGAQAFRKYVIQRCWAHILNEARYLARTLPDNEDAQYILARLQKIFHDAKKFTGTRGQRVRKRHEYARRVREIAARFKGDPDLAEFMTKLDNAAHDLFLFVVYPWVPPTNNPAEKLLREPVIVRKIRGALRSLRGATALCALLSCKTTWEMHGLRPLAEIRRVL